MQLARDLDDPHNQMEIDYNTPGPPPQTPTITSAINTAKKWMAHITTLGRRPPPNPATIWQLDPMDYAFDPSYLALITKLTETPTPRTSLHVIENDGRSL